MRDPKRITAEREKRFREAITERQQRRERLREERFGSRERTECEEFPIRECAEILGSVRNGHQFQVNEELAAIAISAATWREELSQGEERWEIRRTIAHGAILTRRMRERTEETPRSGRRNGSARRAEYRAALGEYERLRRELEEIEREEREIEQRRSEAAARLGESWRGARFVETQV